MKIAFEKYNPLWKYQLESIKGELEGNIGFLNLRIEHIDGTSVEEYEGNDYYHEGKDPFIKKEERNAIRK